MGLFFVNWLNKHLQRFFSEKVKPRTVVLSAMNYSIITVGSDDW